MARHKLPRKIFQEVASGQGGSAIPLLRAAQYSKRLVQLRAIFDIVAERAPAAGTAANLDQSARVLASLQRVGSTVVADVLTHPHVGAWAAFCLRRLQDVREYRVPLWVDLGHLGTIAAVAAMRTGIESECIVPVRDGSAYFPSLGRAVLAMSRDSTRARVECFPDRLQIYTEDEEMTVVSAGSCANAAWQPLRRLRAQSDGKLAACVELDDLDPYRHGYGLPATSRLNDHTFRLWERQFVRAWQILCDRHPDRAETVANGLLSIVPLERNGEVREASASSCDAIGMAALTRPVSSLNFAVSLVHEVEHSKLNALHDLIPLCESGANELMYSPWRDDPRPVFGLLHGTYAFLGIAAFWDNERTGENQRLAEFEFARIVRQIRTVHDVLTRSVGLTRAGRQVVAAMGDSIEHWRGSRILPEALHLAEILDAEHRANWRLRNALPDSAIVNAHHR